MKSENILLKKENETSSKYNYHCNLMLHWNQIGNHKKFQTVFSNSLKVHDKNLHEISIKKSEFQFLTKRTSCENLNF